MARESRNTPQNLINTYGPVVKVRWSTYTNTEETAEEFEETNKQNQIHYIITILRVCI